jgi:hypothetical protein
MRKTVKLVVGIALLAGCGSDPTPTQATSDLQPQTASQAASVQQDLATLRQVTAQFHDFDTASHAGWSTPITGCMVDPAGAGGMGYHYGNTKLIDGSVRVDEPELLLYEPEQNGRLRLVAVEYIVPLTAWTSSVPPRLFGRDFKVNQAFQIWGLHAWVWKDNPSGMFADWNPVITCANAATVSTMSH